MSGTPRTDAELERYRGPTGMVLAEFARQLERELNAKNAPQEGEPGLPHAPQSRPRQESWPHTPAVAAPLERREKIEYAADWLRGYLTGGEGMHNLTEEDTKHVFRTAAEQMCEFFWKEPNLPEATSMSALLC